MNRFSRVCSVAGCFLLMFSLSACDSMIRNTERVGGTARTSFDNARARLARYIYDPKVVQAPPPLATKYCYKLQMDTLCYSEPRPELAGQFVGGQDAGGYIESLEYAGGVAPVSISAPIPVMPADTVAMAPLDSVRVGDTPRIADTAPLPPSLSGGSSLSTSSAPTPLIQHH